MKKKLLWIVMLLAVLLPAKAQNSLQSQINEIKSSPDYVYGEATDGDREDAQRAAFEDLMYQANRWAVNMTGDNDVEMSDDDVREMVQKMETMRGSKTRMFLYVSCGQLASLLREAGYKVNYQAPSSAPASTAEPVQSQQSQTQSQTSSTDELGEIIVVSIEGLSDDEVLDVYLYNSDKMTPEQVAAVERAASRVADRDNLSQGTGTALEQILAVRSFYDLKGVMVPLKLRGKIKKLGKYRTMREPEKSYLIVYDTDARIRAVLSPGVSRKNLYTGQSDSIYNYGGCGAIWFQLNE